MSTQEPCRCRETGGVRVRRTPLRCRQTDLHNPCYRKWGPHWHHKEPSPSGEWGLCPECAQAKGDTDDIYCDLHAAAFETVERAESLGTALLAERAKNADLRAALEEIAEGVHWEGRTEGAHYAGRGVCIASCAGQMSAIARAAIAKAKGEADV